MRDPDASIAFDGATVSRHLKRPLEAEHFLYSEQARRWVDADDLVAYRVRTPTTVESDRLPFVTYPFEWCDSQIHAAGRLTLRLQQEAVEAGFDLKDASAWNVIFRGQLPIFCDLLSFQRLQARRWWAAGQFARHFVLPLLLARRRGLHGHQVFQSWRDGMPPAVGRQMLGWSRYLTRYWPLMAEARGTAAVDKPCSPARIDPEVASITRFRRGLQASLSWMLDGVKPAPNPGATQPGVWLGYMFDRSHYPGNSVELKRNTIAAWLARIRPTWVADLGCNEGEFSVIALDSGAHVVAIDSDHACIDSLFRREPASSRLFPMVAALDDLSRGRGWAGTEYSGLTERLAQRIDCGMMLALVHHLAIGAAVPIDLVAEFAAHCTRDYLVIEWIDSSDPQLRELCGQRQRASGEFGIEVQRAAFMRVGFEIAAEVALHPAARTLALLRRVGPPQVSR